MSPRLNSTTHTDSGSLGRVLGSGRLMTLRDSAWLNLVFMAEVLVEAEKRSFQTLEWKVTVEVTEGKRNFLVWPEDRYQLGTCENRCKPSTS